MEKIRDELDNLLLDTYKIENLLKLLEDYFYGENNYDNFCKGQTVTDIVLEKMKILDDKINKLYSQIFELEKGGQV